MKFNKDALDYYQNQLDNIELIESHIGKYPSIKVWDSFDGVQTKRLDLTPECIAALREFLDKIEKQNEQGDK